MRVGAAYRRGAAQDSYDVVVIGSGIGGLVTAALLAEHGGLRVLVLERHYSAGGFTHTFRRPGFEWDVGVHYIGDVNREGSAFRALFDHLTRGELEWADMGDGYDTLVFGDDRYALPRGREALRRMLISRFPAEEAGIHRYFRRVAGANRWTALFFAEKVLPSPVPHVFGSALRYPFLRHARNSTAKVVSECVGDPRLRGVLTAQWGDYGLPPAESSFGIHAMVVNHFFGGGAYPVGGSSRIAETIIPMIERRGGAVLTCAAVESVLVDDGPRVTGVRMADGREFHARRVVSDAGVARTFDELLPQHALTGHRAPWKAPAVAPSTAHVSLYLGIRGTAAELDLPKSNLWVHGGYDHDANFAQLQEDAADPFPAVFISFPSAKDPSFERRHPGVSTVEAVTFVPYAWFRPWESSRWRKRGADYDGFKAHLSERLLQTVHREIPAIRGRIIHAELSTPLSTRHFTGHAHGEIYGLAHSPARFDARWLRPRTPVEGLFLSGADVAVCGVAGALAGGVLSASAMLGKNLLPDIARRGRSAVRGRLPARSERSR
ncbi:phytoene desaturase family protein [Streptomyces sp. NPDC054932]